MFIETIPKGKSDGKSHSLKRSNREHLKAIKQSKSEDNVKLLRTNLFFIYCVLSLVLGQTACLTSNYKIIKSEVPPAPGKGSITGTVLSETDGKPLENVEVLLCRDAVMLAGCTGKIGQTRTGPNGVYRFRNLPPGSYLPAIKRTENKLYVLQEQKRGEFSPKAVLFNLEAGQTFQIEPQKVTVETQNADQPALKLKYPTNFETIQERKPKLAWEAIPGTDQYYPTLLRIDTQSGEQTDVRLENGGVFRPVNTTSVSPLEELEDGIYMWVVWVPGKQDSQTNSPGLKGEGYFVVVGGEKTEK